MCYAVRPFRSKRKGLEISVIVCAAVFARVSDRPCRAPGRFGSSMPNGEFFGTCTIRGAPFRILHRFPNGCCLPSRKGTSSNLLQSGRYLRSQDRFSFVPVSRFSGAARQDGLQVLRGMRRATPLRQMAINKYFIFIATSVSS